MSAGNLSISVMADLAALDAQFAKIEAAFLESGKRAGTAFQGASSKDTGQGIAEEVSRAIKAAMPEKVAKAVEDTVPKAIDDAVTKGAKQAMDVSVPKAIEVVAAKGATAQMRRAGERGGFDFTDSFQNKSLGMIKSVAGPMMAAGLANAVANFMRSDKSIPDAILDGIKTIPFVGAFANLGEAIYEKTFGAADKAAEDLVKKQNAARESLLGGADRRNSLESENASTRGSLMLENRRLELAQQVAIVRKSGNERGIAYAEYEQKLGELNLETAIDSARTEDDVANKMIGERHDRKLALLMAERDLTLQNLEEAARKEAEQNEKLALANDARAKEQADAEEKRIQRETEAQIEQERRIALQAEKDNEMRIKQIGELEQERMSSQQAGIGSAQTALGSFKFDAYPAADKRKNDDRIVRSLEAIRDQQKTAGFI
jgi:hypothetical protein